MRWVQLCSISIVAASILHAAEVTCDFIPFQPAEYSYTSKENPAHHPQAPREESHWRILMRPTGGLIGHARIEGLPPQSTWSAHLLIYEALDKDLLPPSKENKNGVWFHPMGLVKPEAPRRALRHEAVLDITQTPYEIPIILPHLSGKLYRGILEIRDAAGTPLHTETIGELFQCNASYYRYQSNKAWIAAKDQTAHGKLRQCAQISETETIDALPTDWRPLLDTTALWIDATNTISDTMLRRYLLTGRWVFGQPDEISQILPRLGLTEETALFSGGIRSLVGEKQLWSSTPQILDFQHSYYQGRDLYFPLENAGDLFSHIKDRYLTFTLISAGLYALGATILLPLLFFKLKGAKLLQIWWKAPLCITLYSALILLIGWTFTQPHMLLTDVTEVRMGYADWPEVYCQTTASALRFGRQPLGWHIPPDSITLEQDGKSTRQLLVEGNARAGTLTYTGIPRAMRLVSTTHTFQTMTQPFAAVYDGTTLTITSERDVRNVHIALKDERWVNVGDIKEGQSIVVGADAEVTHISGIPNQLEAALDRDDRAALPYTKDDAEQENCKNCNAVHLRHSAGIARLGNAILVIGVDSEASPAVHSLDTNEQRAARVAWISQVPLKELAASTTEGVAP